MNNKGMEATQMFIYIVSIVVVALVMLFGIRAVVNWQEDMQNVRYIQFKTQLENTIDEIASDFGSVKQLNIKSPGDFSYMCFVDKSFPADNLADDYITLDGIPYPEIIGAWRFGSDNIFLVDGLVRQSFNSDKVVIQNPGQDQDWEGYTCIKQTQGVFKVRFEGLGRTVAISGWS